MSFDLQGYMTELAKLCAIDSGMRNREGTAAMAAYFEERYRSLGLNTEIRYYDGNDFAPFLLAGNALKGPIDVLFVAHMDTVFPVGDGAARPLTVDENSIARGPGCIDCKGGCLLIYELVRQLMDEGTDLRFCVAMNSDEERGSRYSRCFFEELAARSEVCLVFEPGRANDEFVSERKGGANFLIRCHGVAAHSGVDPQNGASAILELAKWLPELYALVDYDAGTTLNVGRIQGGGDNGQVPDYCECTVSFRSLVPEALDGLRALFERMKTQPFDARTRIEVEQVSLRPAMRIHPKTAKLIDELEAAGREESLPVEHIVTGGGSDGNFIACFGVALLDGCGPCGGKLHTTDEYLKVDTVPERFRLMLRLLHRLAGRS